MERKQARNRSLVFQFTMRMLSTREVYTTRMLLSFPLLNTPADQMLTQMQRPTVFMPVYETLSGVDGALTRQVMSGRLPRDPFTGRQRVR